MKKYNVELHRSVETWEYISLEIEAESSKEAETIACKEAEDSLWWNEGEDYTPSEPVVHSVEEI